MDKSTSINLRVNKKQILLVLLMVIGLYVIVPQIGDFKSSLHLLLKPQPQWVVVAVALTATTYFAGALTYLLLAFKKLRYQQVVLVQLAAMFINRLLPGGIGALGANYAYLRHAKHSPTQAGSAVAINNLLGVVGHVVLVVGTMLLYSGQTNFVSGSNKFINLFLVFSGILALVFVLVYLVFGRKKFVRALKDIRKQLLSYKKRPLRLPLALLSSMSLTAFNVLCLSACAMAMGVHVSFAVVLLIFSFGVGAGTATPTPGGLGGFEAGLVAGFVAYGVATPVALAVALLYRIISYWLPLLVGGVAFIICQQRQLFSAR